MSQPSLTFLTAKLTDIKTRRTALQNAISTTTPVTPAQIQQLRDIYAEQLSLYQLINDLNKSYDQTLQASQQLTSYQNDLMSKMDNIHYDKSNKINEVIASKQDMVRKSKINRYYSDKYEAMIKLIKIITMMLIPTIALAYLNKKEYIPQDAFHIAAIIIVVIGGIFFLKQFIDITRKSKMDFSEYEIPFKEPSPSTD